MPIVFILVVFFLGVRVDQTLESEKRFASGKM